MGHLYNNGATDYKILIPENATEPEKYAAKEGKRIFSLAYVDIKTVTDKGLTADETKRYISIGNTVYFKKLNVKLTQSEFKFDGFIIKNVGNTYVIKGVSDTGDIFFDESNFFRSFSSSPRNAGSQSAAVFETFFETESRANSAFKAEQSEIPDDSHKTAAAQSVHKNIARSRLFFLAYQFENLSAIFI